MNGQFTTGDMDAESVMIATWHGSLDDSTVGTKEA